MDVRAVNRRVIEQFRAGGPIEGMHRDRLVLLTTTGRRTGTPHTTPMMFHPDGDRILVIASNVGAPAHPDWYLNLLAEPAVTVELDTEDYPATATPLRDADYDRAWAEIVRLYPFFADHQRKTERTIPVVALRR
ncbi:deazaflavin-dependent nitroreductase family protein [Nocardia nova SH22a]|uniref:Deazaflavin-dependent nitroreductase family protein n=1 Tax=Nocardia nova SH22a TaxID=1415166 RepID=W5TMF1_9NOCA|nr:nitroreductase/quinone reductase family protein [Nocardia nova]AHH20173.1 deazaflavin-dependent nitroreductase family protein [Nocardia nova SH22a]